MRSAEQFEEVVVSGDHQTIPVPRGDSQVWDVLEECSPSQGGLQSDRRLEIDR